MPDYTLLDGALTHVRENGDDSEAYVDLAIEAGTDIGAPLEDNDLVPLFDTSANAPRKGAASRFWDYIKSKLGIFDGTWASGGTSTTTKPRVLVEATGATSNNWNTNGSGLGVNAASGFSGNLIDLQLNGGRRFVVSSVGNVTAYGAMAEARGVRFQTGTYTNFGETLGGAATIFGNNIAPHETTSNAVWRYGGAGDAGNFIRMRYDTGITFHVNVFGTFGAAQADNVNEVVRISLSGNVGIGSTNPGPRLDVKAPSTFANDLAAFTFDTNVVFRVARTGDVHVPQVGGSLTVGAGAKFGKLCIRGVGFSTDSPYLTVWNDQDDGAAKNGGIGTRSRMTSRYLYTASTLGNNDYSFGNPGIINTTAWEYSNNTYTTLVAPTEFKGWNWQYYTGSAYAQLLTVGLNGVGVKLPSLGSLPTAPLDVNGDTIRLRTARTPASATAAGNAGEICWDSSFLYVCVAANTWKRTALATW